MTPMVGEGNWARVSLRELRRAATRPERILTTGRPTRGMPAFNLLGQAISDLVCYRSAARILTNKTKRRLYKPGTIHRTGFSFRYPQQWRRKGANEKFKPAEGPPESWRATSDWPKPPGSAAK